MQTDLIASLSLAAPEVLLALSGLALLMIGVFSGERASTLVNGLAVAVLIAALALVVISVSYTHLTLPTKRIV